MDGQQFCASCGCRLVNPFGAPLVQVGTYRYHRICWVMKEAPSVKAAAMEN